MLSGTIPTEMVEIHGMRMLHLCEFPIDLQKVLFLYCSDLIGFLCFAHINSDKRTFNGTIPVEFGGLVDLTELVLGNNNCGKALYCLLILNFIQNLITFSSLPR